MAELYLITPRQFDLDAFAPQLEHVLSAVDVACVRLALDSPNEDVIRAAAEKLKEICANKDVPLVLAEHFRLAHELGLDGVHLNGTQHIRAARDLLRKGAIVGSYCGTSRHAGLNAGEIGADYVSFGPVTASALGSGDVADTDLFNWWFQMIEIPIVAEGHVTKDAANSLREIADFLCVGEEIWNTGDPVQALKDLIS